VNFVLSDSSFTPQMDNMTILRSGHLHRVTTHVNHKFVRVKPSEKIPTLLKLLEESRMHSTIIFCNQHQTVQKVYNACVEHGLLVAKVDSADFVEVSSLSSSPTEANNRVPTRH